MKIYIYKIDNHQYSVDDIDKIPEGIDYNEINLEIPIISQEQKILEMIEIESEKYEQRIQDGIKAVSKLSAELRISKVNGLIDETAHRAIDLILTPVRTDILAGQWIGAKQLLIEIGSKNIGEVLYNKILDNIDSYISENYVDLNVKYNNDKKQ